MQQHSGSRSPSSPPVLCDEERGIPCDRDYWGRPGNPREAPPLESWHAQTALDRMVTLGLLTEQGAESSRRRSGGKSGGWDRSWSIKGAR